MRISGAATATELGSFDLLDDVFRAAVDQDFVKRLIAADGDVLLDIVWIDEAAVAQNDFLLALEEGNVAPQRNFRIAADRISPGR